MGRAAALSVTGHVALRLGRVSNLPTVWTNVLAGLVLSGAPLRTGPTISLMLALSLFYIAGMVLNDAFDADFDRLHRPGRPIPSGEVEPATVFLLGAGLLGAGLALLLWLGLAPGGAGLRGVGAGSALAAAIVVYDAWHKGNPAGPLLMGLCRILAYVTAAVAGGGAVGSPLLWGCAAAFCYLVGLTYVAKQEDLRRPGRLWPLAILVVPFAYALPIAARGGSGLVLFLALAGAVGTALVLMARAGRSAMSRVVAILIAGISLLDGLMVAGRGLPGLALLTALGFGVTLASQRAVAGT